MDLIIFHLRECLTSLIFKSLSFEGTLICLQTSSPLLGNRLSLPVPCLSMLYVLFEQFVDTMPTNSEILHVFKACKPTTLFHLMLGGKTETGFWQLWGDIWGRDCNWSVHEGSTQQTSQGLSLVMERRPETELNVQLIGQEEQFANHRCYPERVFNHSFNHS